MKRRLIYPLAFSLLLAITVLSNVGQAAPQRFRADSGIVTLGPNQVLRLTIGAANGTDKIKARVGWKQYGAQSCSSAPVVCRHMVIGQGETPLTTVAIDEAVSFDVQQVGTGVRAVVESNNPNTQVVAMVFDTTTQQIISMVIMANTEGD